MREIKFRAWWKDTMKPIPNFTDDYVIDACNEDIFIVCQYTGLKDKNGKEIYEGDICKISDWKPKPVIWDDGRFWLKDSLVMISQLEIDCGCLEVVGNIYENPELLEAE